MPKNLLEIPKNGVPHEEILNTLKEEQKKGDIKPQSGRVFGLSYLVDEEHTEFLKRAYSLYFEANALNPMSYPSLKNMEAEVVAMTAWMLNGTRKTTGTMTSGGTESILMGIKTHRDWARDTKGVTKPEMILPITAHPAFEKAAHYFDVKPVHIPIRDDFRADIESIKKVLNENTILIVGSAPCYPYGVIDPIEDLATIAAENDIGCHIDACLGGFMLPWVEKLGHPIYCKWDFRIPGVTSISADLHKYGFAAKPASTILYRSDDIRKYQFYIYSDWCGGVFGSPSMPGSRPGGAIAAAWAALKALGQEGYISNTRDSMEIAKKMMDGINSIEGLHIMGEPDMAIYAWTFDDDVDLDFFTLLDILKSKGGWTINRMQSPPAAHHMTSRTHMPIVDEFLSDLKWSMKKLRSLPSTAKIEGQAAMYGMMATIKDREKTDQIVRDLLLQTYSYHPKKKN